MYNRVYKHFAITPQIQELPLYLTGAGITQPEMFVNRPDGQEVHQISFVQEGNGVLIHEGKHYLLKPGDCFCIEKGQPMHYYPTEPPMATAWVVFDGNMAASLMKLLMKSEGTYIFSLKHPEIPISKSLDIINSVQTSTNHIRHSAALYSLIMEIFYRQKSSAEEPILTPRFYPAIQYMEQNFKHDLSLDDIAAVVGLSKYQFCRVFHKTYQISPFSYLINLRLHNAKKLLIEEPKLSIKDIALLSGFRDASYFGSTFRRYVKMTPNEYRQIYGNEIET